MIIKNKEELKKVVMNLINSTKIVDVHTHLYAPCFGELLLWGIDELITYHYLICEAMRINPISYKEYWSMPKEKQADYIYKSIFVNNTPISEAARGVLTVLQELGIPLTSQNLSEIRNYFKEIKLEDYINKIFEKANLEYIVMTNDPFDEKERKVWESSPSIDSRFKAALRLDGLLNNYAENIKILHQMNYKVDITLNQFVLQEIRRFLEDWIKKMNPLYMAVSVGPDFKFPEDSIRGRLIEHCILPVARDYNIPLALMVGVKKLINPYLRVAGDSVGTAGMEALEYLALNYPSNKFLVTYLSREDQHQLCVTARKFSNIMVFGCWWFLNNPSIIEEITKERLELLGFTFIPQHSDSRILDQLIYKWKHSREIIGNILWKKYCDIIDSGWELKEEDIKRDIQKLFKDNFEKFLQ